MEQAWNGLPWRIKDFIKNVYWNGMWSSPREVDCRVDSTSYFERLHETEHTDHNAENDNFIYINGVHRVIFRL